MSSLITETMHTNGKVRKINKRLETQYNHILDILQNEHGNNPNLINKYSGEYCFVKEFSPSRSNVIAWLPLQRKDEILELNAGCGAVTEYLTNKVKQVDCIEESEVQCQINRIRNQSAHNLKIYQGTVKENYDRLHNKRYDYVIIWDSINDINLDDIRSLIKPKGYMVIVADNRYGLKYWNGSADNMEYFEELYSGEYGVDKDQILQQLRDTGFTDITLYYPYPDYRSTRRIYSNDYMPKLGELNENFYFGGEKRLVLFEETNVYNQLIEQNKYAEFSNSYIFVAAN